MLMSILLALVVVAVLLQIYVTWQGRSAAGQIGVVAQAAERAAETSEQAREILQIRLREEREVNQGAAQALRSELSGRFEDSSSKLIATLSQELANNRSESSSAAAELRSEMQKGFSDHAKTALAQADAASQKLGSELDRSRRAQAEQGQVVERKLEALRDTVDGHLKHLQISNENKLEQMRQTVEEKLEGTLEKRLGQSFQQVSKQLAEVYSGLGEMKSLATGVGDLKRLMSNVKARGVWGEIQLGALLSQVLSPEHYAEQVTLKPGSSERVDFAVRMPGSGAEVMLPIDSKWPQAAWARLVTAEEIGDSEALRAARKELSNAVIEAAKSIREKYVVPPRTTDFAVLFVPIEGLFAEVVRQPELVERLQNEFRVMVVGPTNLGALLNSLQLGFRTLAIEKRSSEVREVLGAVKTEFGKFEAVLAKIRTKLDQAGKVVDEAGTRTRAMGRKLRTVEGLPDLEAGELLELPAADESISGPAGPSIDPVHQTPEPPKTLSDGSLNTPSPG